MTTMERQTWLQERRAYLGGTDLAALAGKSKWATALDVYAAKVLDIQGESSRAAEVGIVLEDLVANWVELDNDIKLVRCPAVRHPEYSFLGGNPDRLCDDDQIWDIKTCGYSALIEWGEPGTDEVPPAYAIQMAWYCGLTGRPEWRIARCLRDRLDVDIYEGKHNPSLYDSLVKIGVNFWQSHVATKIPPPAEGKKSELDSLKALYPKENGEIVIATTREDAAAERYLEAQSKVSAAHDERDGLKAILISAIGEATAIETAVGRFTYKSSANGIRSLRHVKPTTSARN